MIRNALSILFVGLAAASAAAQSGAASARPCYVVIAVDVSGSMERADTPAEDGRGLPFTLRQEAQVVAMQLLPYLYSDLYMGVCHFSDRVRYALPSEDTASLLAWGGSYLNEAACRNMVRSPDFTGSFNTDLEGGLDWALMRIQAARLRHGEGPGKVILLSRGDPRNSARRMEIGSPLHTAAWRLAQQDIAVYPVIINRGSHRAGFEADEPSSSDREAEASMTALASMTEGTAYRITSSRGLPDILMDVFGLGTPLSDQTPVSRYDWATVVVGPAPASLTVRSVGTETEVQARAWPVDRDLEAETGIRVHRVTGSQGEMTILRRPEAANRIADSWEGLWKLASPGETRLYRIPSFVLQLESRPGAPWWVHEEVRVAAHVVDRHPGARSIRSMEGSDALSVRLAVRAQGQRQGSPLEGGEWTSPLRLYESDSFTIRVAGPYDFGAGLIHRLGDEDVRLVDARGEITVQPPCVSMSVRDGSGQVLGSLSNRSEPLAVELHGGQEVTFDVSAEGRSGAKPVSGTVHLEPMAQRERALATETETNLATDAVELPKGYERISGWAQVQVETPAGVRPFRLPRFALTYQAAPVERTCVFSEPREALWAGELHRQLVTISAFPVFERDRERVLGEFPDTLEGVRLRTLDLTSGTAQVMTPRVRLVEVPKATGENGRTLTAIYALESEIPLPRDDQCEISLEGEIDDLQGAVKRYGMIDPLAAGGITWALSQPSEDPRPRGLTETIYCGEPVTLSAEWQAGQQVSAVRFEIERPEPDGTLTVDLPVGGDDRRASVERVLPGLQSGQTYPLYAYVTAQPADATASVEVKLHGGQFRARDRRLLLSEMSIGDEAGKDVACYPWEPAQIPLRVVFGGYIASNAQHQALIDRVKTSCRVMVTSPAGEAQDVTDSIEWTALVPSDTREGRATRCELQGYAPYTARNVGRAAVEMTIDFPQERAEATTRRAYGHLAIKEPRLALSVQRVTTSDQDSLFDSQAWATGSGGVSAITTQLSTRLRISVRPLNWTATTPPGLVLRVLRRPSAQAPWTIAFSSEGEPTGGAELTDEVQVGENGQYAVELVGRDRPSGQIVANLTTPVLVSIQPHEIVPVLSPAAWITPHVRQWPFEYRVSVQKENGQSPQASAMAFQFCLPSDEGLWYDGSVHLADASGDRAAPLSLRSPEFLPPLEVSGDGSVRFRLMAEGLELVQWEHPNVRVLEPVLERLSFSGRPDAAEMAAVQGRIEFDGSSRLWARPVFRAAPELAGQWTRGATKIYVWPVDEHEDATRQLSAREVQRLESEEALTIDSGQASQTAKILPRLAPRKFWGWPTPGARYRYAVAASTTYARADAPEAVIREWTDVTTIAVATAEAIPWCWWVLAGLLVALVGVFVLKMLAPRPNQLGLDVRLAENVATVEPASASSPVTVELQPSSLRSDLDLHLAHVRRSGNGAGALAAVLASAGVLLRRAFYPRRWAWALITPRIGGTRSVQKGLLCLWTGPLARKGRLWSSQTGPVQVPANGQVVSITLDLAYEIETTRRSMRVTVRIMNTAARSEVERFDEPATADPELRSQETNLFDVADERHEESRHAT